MHSRLRSQLLSFFNKKYYYIMTIYEHNGLSHTVTNSQDLATGWSHLRTT
ncbi:hypothetical protein DSUL_30059 [Desulfovibrionales bacterium]